MRVAKCLIVDDEPIARQIIQTYCEHLPQVQVIGSCGNALEAKAFLQREDVDILFLDINMPVLSGIAFLKTLRTTPQVIFTTAYKEYAVDAFDLAACDYLLKPFSLERFIVAIDKATERLRPIAPIEMPKTEDFVFIKSEGRIYKVRYEDVLYAEANGNYTKIITHHQTLLSSMTFTHAEELFSNALFLRIHRSFLINKAQISHIEGNRVFIHHFEIPIGSSYREQFLKDVGL
ncbi:DNA-binding LytR/AlgR family response regulator [Siphonobacter sp. SORGH_AS 1065]|nr:DNA-binding LytR/AlgR family response regulator [Siphonobacter sp. SORGH_AS_1065]